MPVKLYTIGVYLLLCLECHCPLFLLTWQVNSPGLHILHSSKGTGLSSCSHPHYTVDICVLIRKFLGEETFLSSSLSSCLLMDECSVVLRSPRQKSNKLSRLLPFYIGVLLPFLEWFFFFLMSTSSLWELVIKPSWEEGQDTAEKIKWDYLI